MAYFESSTVEKTRPNLLKFRIHTKFVNVYYWNMDFTWFSMLVGLFFPGVQAVRDFNGILTNEPTSCWKMYLWLTNSRVYSVCHTHSSDFEIQPRREKRPIFWEICPRGGSIGSLIFHILLRYCYVHLYKLPQRTECSCGLTVACFLFAFLGVGYLYSKIVKEKLSRMYL